METPVFRITLDHDREIVRVTVLSDINKTVGEEIITKARTLSMQHQYALLYDVRDIHLDASSADLFYLPRKLAVLKAPKGRRLRVALLISAGKDQKDYLFYENVTHNMGLNVRVFLDNEEALAWLGTEA